MSKESQGQVVVLEESKAGANEVAENPVVVSDEGKLLEPKLKGVGSVKKEITKLKEEIESIQLANSKVEDAKLRGIPKDAIADDISHAGLSIEERREKIEILKSQKESPGKKLRKALGTLFSF
jgi:hypothetical protein